MSDEELARALDDVREELQGFDALPEAPAEWRSGKRERTTGDDGGLLNAAADAHERDLTRHYLAIRREMQRRRQPTDGDVDTGHYDDGHSFGWKERPEGNPNIDNSIGDGLGWDTKQPPTVSQDMVVDNTTDPETDPRLPHLNPTVSQDMVVDNTTDPETDPRLPHLNDDGSNGDGGDDDDHEQDDDDQGSSDSGVNWLLIGGGVAVIIVIVIIVIAIMSGGGGSSHQEDTANASDRRTEPTPSALPRVGVRTETVGQSKCKTDLVIHASVLDPKYVGKQAVLRIDGPGGGDVAFTVPAGGTYDRPFLQTAGDNPPCAAKWYYWIKSVDGVALPDPYAAVRH